MSSLTGSDLGSGHGTYASPGLWRCTGYIPIVEAVLKASTAHRNADKR